MVEYKPISIGIVAYVLGMSSKKLFRWYKESLSGYWEAEQNGDLEKDNLRIREKGKEREIAVPILEEKHLGAHMAVDEKSINGNIYTILSNRETGKVALMAATIKTSYLVQIIKRFDVSKRMEVKSLSRDMARHYEWFGNQAFMNAYHIVDKFHVVKNILEQLQAVRIHYRQQELAKRREAKQTKQAYSESTFDNGDTILQLLARSRGLLFLWPKQWSEQQQQRAKILFKNYPEIELVYKAVMRIRRWFKATKAKKTYQKTRDKKKEEIVHIIKELQKSGINELKNIALTFKNNLPQILHYFIAKETNAKAEAINQNIQRFINANYGTRNLKFFLFRIKIYFT